MADQLSGIAIIICIAFGVLTFILLFLFAKRQITRFALNSRRGPHVPVADDAPKHLSREVERRLDAVKKCEFEGNVLTKEKEQLYFRSQPCDNSLPTHLYRLKVVQEMRNLDKIIAKQVLTTSHAVEGNLLSYFCHLKENDKGSSEFPDINEFLQLYEHARYEPKVFSYEEYQHFMELLECVKCRVDARTKGLPSQHSELSELYSDDEKVPFPESTSLLLKKSVSYIFGTNRRKHVPAETPV